MGDKKFRIIEFYMAVTNRCNLQCIMCTTGKGKYDASKELSTDEWIKAIINLDKSCDIQRITFGGGEPLLRKDIVELVRFACSTGIGNINIISNGILLDEKFMASFTGKELSKLGIILSIDGLEYEHNFIRGPETFQKVFKNFEYLYHNYFTRDRIYFLSLSSILMPENFANYIDFLEFFKKFTGVRVDIQPVIPNNEICYIKNHFSLTDAEKNKLERIVDFIADNPQISARQSSVIKYYAPYFDNKLIKTGRCLTGYESLNITYEGYPYLCGKEIPMPVYKFDFQDIFYSKEYQNELERIGLCKEPCLQGLHINPDNSYASGG